MKWIYGKQELKSIERGQENCYLLTNGLGGFSSLTITGSAARNDHALLMACVKAPNHRYNMVHRMAERLLLGEEEIFLSTQEFEDGHKEEGYMHLSAFVFEDSPIWKYHVKGVSIHKEMGMQQGENTLALRYRVENRGRTEVRLVVTPFYQFTEKGKEPEEAQRFVREGNAIHSNGQTLFFETNGTVTDHEEIREKLYYSYDACDGRRETGLAKAIHSMELSVRPGESAVLKVVYSMEDATKDGERIIEEMKARRKQLEETAGFILPVARELAKSANQFVSQRASTRGSTILAGYPFFEDWGRDTMIALPGICISTGQYETAAEILRTFAANEHRGLMPNLFPEGGKEPLYNTVDAALLFINCVYLYYQATKEEAFVQEMYPVMERIVNAYQKGTDFGIHMEEDGLIRAGEGLWQVTWMDVRVGEILPTPRHGKPVEINAYWYNALCVMDALAPVLNRKPVYGALSAKVRQSFVDKFWMEDKKCLKDLVSGTKADTQIRCNQIWAVSMPFTMLDEAQENMVVETVFEKLYTPYGLRTLEEGDGEFHPWYQGPMEERDMAYHQGTVWTFPLGAYYLAYLKVHHGSAEARKKVQDQLEVLEAAMREGCIGQLPEIYDGKNPTRSKGCFAQAWSVGEMLRVYEALERGETLWKNY